MNKKTPWAVFCHVHGQRFLTREQYDIQLSRPNAFWTCPICGEVANWDDDNYEKCMEIAQPDIDPKTWRKMSESAGAESVEF